MENPKLILEEATRELLDDMRFKEKINQARGHPSKEALLLQSTPILTCYSQLLHLQERSKLFSKLPLKEILEQDKRFFEKILVK